MDELEILKKDWKKNENAFDQVTEKEIYGMLHKRSSSIVKWILIISVLELLLWSGITFLTADEEYFKTLEMYHLDTIMPIISVINYGVILFFIYLFFKNYKGYQQASIKITIDDRPAHVWFPTISTEAKKEHSQWLNYLNEDWSVIKEENIREDGKIVTNEVGELSAVFARMKDNFGKFSYRFIGNFELKTISEDRKSCEYHKVSDRLYIDYENEKLLMQAFI